jgi:hypothetical protein
LSPIYIPPLHCGLGAMLRLKSEYTIENVQIAKGERCVVTDIIGYKYEVNFKDLNLKTIIFNNEIPIYFDIETEGVRDWINEDKKLVNEVNSSKINLKKDLVIKNVITFPKGKEFYAVPDTSNDDKKFWDLYDSSTYERILRLKYSEVKEYFNG